MLITNEVASAYAKVALYKVLQDLTQKERKDDQAIMINFECELQDLMDLYTESEIISMMRRIFKEDR